ncbi:MAG: MurNAc alpha-1-phosphate uridylyltransferase [Saprospiraceae bacterium]|jgi:MurNAc alpha-1-phosphate uridylyltransferase
MDAMILAAGRGARLKPITDHTPKPLVEVHGYALIELQLLRLRQYGVTNIVINLAHLGNQIEHRLGNGKQYGVRISYSHENAGALETAGGIIKALPLLQGNSFLVVNADIVCDIDYGKLMASQFNTEQLACLVMIANPAHHPNGDFTVDHGGLTEREAATGTKMTFSGVAHYRRIIFENLPSGKQALSPLLHQLIKQEKVAAYEHHGLWHDVGTPERLTAVREAQDVREYIDSLR